MSKSIRDVYLSENNVDFLYQDVSNQVLQQINFNLNSSPKYKNTVFGMMDKVYSNADKQIITNLTALNRYTTKKISDYYWSSCYSTTYSCLFISRS